MRIVPTVPSLTEPNIWNNFEKTLLLFVLLSLCFKCEINQTVQNTGANKEVQILLFLFCCLKNGLTKQKRSCSQWHCTEPEGQTSVSLLICTHRCLPQRLAANKHLMQCRPALLEVTRTRNRALHCRTKDSHYVFFTKAWTHCNKGCGMCCFSCFEVGKKRKHKQRWVMHFEVLVTFVIRIPSVL